MNNKVEIPDIFGDALISVINKCHAKGELITGFVCLIETTDGRKTRMRVEASPEMTEYKAFGMINFASVNFEYSDLDPDEDDDDFYDPNWHDGQ